MKNLLNKIISSFLLLAIIFLSVIACPLSVSANSSGIHPDPNKPLGNILVEGGKYAVFYIISQIGAVADGSFYDFMRNQATWEDYWNGDNITEVTDESGNVISYTFSEELMAYIKQCLDDYAKQEQTKEENGGFYLLPTIDMHDVPIDRFANREQYLTFLNIVKEKGMLSVRVNYNGILYFADPFSDPDHPIYFVAELSDLNLFKDNPDRLINCNYFCANDWKLEGQKRMWFTERGQIYTSCSEAEQVNTGAANYISVVYAGNTRIDTYNFQLYSTTGERVRVFVSQAAAKSYSVGNRKIYFSENYYTYEPEDLTVAVDDLQKSVDDLQKVIDDLLEKISNDSSEKEIEELLRQILEELRKNPGTGSGEGSGGGDVTVNVDMTQTNSWLAQIYAKVSQIFEEMQKDFEEIMEQLKKIRNWAAVDTVIDGVDAVGDWLDLIYDVLTDGAGAAVGTISSALQDSTDLMKQKFPFSIPWDILFFVTVFSAEPETPQFSIPFNFEISGLDLVVDYEMELDFTPLQWLSDLSRLVLSMTYAAGLMKKTVDIVSANKEG